MGNALADVRNDTSQDIWVFTFNEGSKFDDSYVMTHLRWLRRYDSYHMARVEFMSSWNLLTLKSDVDTVLSQAYGIYKIGAKAKIQYVTIT